MATLLAVLLFAISAQGQECENGRVFSMPITNVTISNGATVRGIPIQVGTPPQPLSFLPEWPFDANWVYSGQYPCPQGSKSRVACASANGGQLNRSDSTTLGGIRSPQPDDGRVVAKAQWYHDVFSLTDDVVLTELPFGIDRSTDNGMHPTNTFGLGANSSFIQKLQNQSHVTSNVWSFWWGVDAPHAEDSQDGSFVFGGYDRAKTTGEGYTGQLNPTDGCPTGIQVNVNDLVLNFPNGTSAGIVSPGQSHYAACVRPDWPVAMNVNSAIFQQFEAASNTRSSSRAVGIYYYGMDFPIDQIFDGEVTVQLDQGINPTITNKELVLPDLSINNDTGEIVNGDGRAAEVLINSLTDQNAYDTAILGRAFLSAAYLMVNQDAGTFTLWEAKRTTDQDLVAVCNSTDPGQATSGQKKTLSGGAIAGIVIGALAGLAILFSAIFVYRLKRMPGHKPPVEYAHTAVNNKEAAALAQTTSQQLEGQPVYEKLGSEPAVTHEMRAGEVAHEMRA